MTFPMSVGGDTLCASESVVVPALRHGRRIAMTDTDDTEWITSRQFHASPGVADWRVLFRGAHAFYRLSSFGEGARFVSAIAAAAASLSHHPDVDLRPDGVTIRTSTHPDGRLTAVDAQLAAAISAAAAAQGWIRPSRDAAACTSTCRCRRIRSRRAWRRRSRRVVASRTTAARRMPGPSHRRTTTAWTSRVGRTPTADRRPIGARQQRYRALSTVTVPAETVTTT